MCWQVNASRQRKLSLFFLPIFLCKPPTDGVTQIKGVYYHAWVWNMIQPLPMVVMGQFERMPMCLVGRGGSAIRRQSTGKEGEFVSKVPWGTAKVGHIGMHVEKALPLRVPPGCSCVLSACTERNVSFGSLNSETYRVKPSGSCLSIPAHSS